MPPGPPMGGPMGMPPGFGVPPGPPMGMPLGPPMGMPLGPPGPGMGGIAPIAPAASPYLRSRTPAKAGRPIEPWKDTLRLMMFIWGGALLVAFMVPVRLEPEIGFLFQVIIDGKGIQKLAPLLMASIGLLSIVLAAIPTSPSPRGLIAALLGLAGILIPELVFLTKSDFGLGQVLILLNILGTIMLVPGLLLRSEYQDSIMPRILVTIGVLCVLAGYLIPQNDSIPLIDAFKLLIDGPGKAKVAAIFLLGPAILALVSLLVWLPAPGSAGTKVIAYLWIFWAAIALFTALLVEGSLSEVIGHSPFILVAWVPGGGGSELNIVGSAYLVLTGFGLATVLGKKLE